MDVKKVIYEFKKIYKNKNFIIMISVIILITLGCFVYNKSSKVLNIKRAEKTIQLIRDNKDIEALTIYNDHMSNKVYMNKLGPDVFDYSVEIYKSFLNNPEKFSEYNKKFEFLLTLYKTDIMDSNYKIMTTQKDYLNRINEARICEQNNRYLDAYLKVKNIKDEDCLVYDGFPILKENLIKKNHESIRKTIADKEVIDAYTSLIEYPIKFNDEIEKYEQLVFKYIKKNIESMSEKEGIEYINNIRPKINITEVDNLKISLQESYDEKIQEEKEKKKREEKRKKQEVEKKRKELKDIIKALEKIENLYSDHTFEYLNKDTKNGRTYWVFDMYYMDFGSDCRVYVDTENFDVYENYSDAQFVEYDETRRSVKGTSIAALNSNSENGKYRVSGQIVLMDKMTMLIVDESGYKLHVATNKIIDKIVGEYVTVRGSYYGGKCNNYTSYGIQISVPELVDATIED